MPFNGSGTYSLPAGNPVTTGTTISSTTHNSTMSDIATALSTCLAKDGQTTVTGNIPMGGYKLTNLANGSASTDSVNLGQLQAQTGVYVGTVGGTADAITLTPSPAITAYAAGQRFTFLTSGANTTTVTVNVSGLGTQALTKFGSTALAAGDISAASVLVTIEHDGTRFQLINFLTTGTSGNKVPLLNGANTWSAKQTHSAQVAWAKGADVASASALTLGTDGNYFDITGTTTITSIGTLGIGTRVKLHFDGALTLTHHATDLILPGGANIVTAAGDEIELVEYASGDWIATEVVRASYAEFSIASATTTDLSTASSENVYITGTTGITSFGTSVAGVRRHVRFADVLTITHNATSMICKGGSDITTATNDTSVWFSLGSGNWIEESYDPAAIGPSQAALQGTSTTTLNSASHDFTSIPSWVKKITGIVEGASTNTGSSDTVFIQIGDSGGIEATGYAGAVEDSSGNTAYSTSFGLNKTGIAAAGTLSCQFVLSLLDSSSNTWGFSCTSYDVTPLIAYGMGTKSLSATLDRVRISRTTGTVFDAGKFRILYE